MEKVTGSGNKVQWIKRRWFEIRSGNIYINFVLASVNTIMLVYGFAFLPSVFDNIPVHIFALIFLAIVIPITIGFGRLHLYNQYHTDAMIALEQHPYSFRIVPQSKEPIQLKAQLNMMIAVREMLAESNVKGRIKQKQLELMGTDIKRIELLIEGLDSRNIV